MLIITKLLFSALFGMMVFFSGIITPVAFKNLPEKNLSIFLRKVFPKLFALGFVLSIICGVLLYINNSFIPFVLSTFISLGFIINLVFLTPKINAEIYSPRRRTDNHQCCTAHHRIHRLQPFC